MIMLKLLVLVGFAFIPEIAVGSGGQPPKPVDHREQLLKKAESIVKDPLNWSDKSDLLVDFSRIAAEGKLSKRESVKEFSKAARVLIAAGTKWTSVADRDTIKEYRESMMNIELSLRGAEVGAGSRESESRKKAREIIIAPLPEEDSQEFGEKWEKALDAYLLLFQDFNVQVE